MWKLEVEMLQAPESDHGKPEDIGKKDEELDFSDDDDDDDDWNDKEKHKVKPKRSRSSQSSDHSNPDGSDSDVPLVRRLRKRKRKPARRVASSKLQFDKFSCHVCTLAGTDEGNTFPTFYRLNAHFRKTHGMDAYLFCCNRRWSSTKTFSNHLDNHATLKNDPKRCLECDIVFKDVASCTRHNFVVHTPEDQKQYKCDLCPKAFAAEDLLSSHLSWHDEVKKKNHHCPLCNKYFYNASNLETHHLTHHKNLGESSGALGDEISEQSSAPVLPALPKKRRRGSPEEIATQEELIRKFITLNCIKCEYVGETFTKLAYHVRSVHKMATPSITCCERRFGKRYRLYEHCLRHLNPDHFKCDLCDKTFTDSSGLQHHKWWIHTPMSERPFKCDICGDAFVKDYLLKQHMDRHLDKEHKIHTCELCNVTYTNALQLKTHMQRLHGAVSNWVCDVCARGFTHRALLDTHRLTHTEEGLASLKTQCEICRKWLSNKRNYLRHRRRCGVTATMAKCDVCGHESVNPSALTAHKRLHHSFRPKHTCSYCGKEFKKMLRLKEHEAAHAGIVLYKCPFCPRMCNSSSNMYTHKKTAHTEEWAAAVAARNAGPVPVTGT